MNINAKYNNLTCLSFSHYGPSRVKYYNYRCDCGKEKVIMDSSVRLGHTKSCGCLHLKTVSEKTRFPEVTSNRLPSKWKEMIRRCTNPKHKFYDYYGVSQFVRDGYLGLIFISGLCPLVTVIA